MTSRLWHLLPAVLLLFAPSALRADEPVPDAAAIREKVRAAAGPRATSYRETDETVRSDGSKTVEHDFVRGDDLRYTYDSGRFHYEDGTYHGDAWHMNYNGQVVLEQPDPGVATLEKPDTTVTAVHGALEGFVLATLNARGHGLKEYVDGTAWRVVRREALTPNGKIVTTYDDVRLDNGRTFAHHTHVDDGYSHTTVDVRITAYEPGEVAAADVEIPPPRRALVAFPPDTASVNLPAQFGGSHVYVRVMIGGRGLDFVLDSGADGITIDARVAHELGLTEYAKHSAVGAGRYTTARTIVPEMRIGSLTMRDVVVEEIPHGWETASGVKEVGLLGFDFLAELGVTIDYEHQRVTVVPGASYTAPTDPHAIPLTVRVGDGTPLTTVAINGAVGERWVLDTGGAGTFLIFDYFARRHPEALRDLGGGYDRSMRLFGIGGDIPARPYQIASLKLANVNFQQFVGYRVTDSRAYAEAIDGVIGVDFLRLFTLGFDYANSRVYLVPNRYGRAAMGIK